MVTLQIQYGLIYKIYRKWEMKFCDIDILTLPMTVKCLKVLCHAILICFGKQHVVIIPNTKNLFPTSCRNSIFFGSY